MTSDRRLRTRRQQLHDPTATDYRARRVNSGGSAGSIDVSFFTHLPRPTPYTLSSDTTYSRPKSHARKRSPDHVPRPRNAFILFRCDFVRQKVVPEEYERDHCNLSRIAGAVWNVMSKSDKAPWLELAQLEKKEHAERYPHLRGSKGSKGGKVMLKREDDEERGRSRRSRQDTPSTNFPDMPLFAFEDKPYSYSTAHGFSPIPDTQPVPHTALTYTLPGRRSSSCPPPDSEPASITPPAPVEYVPGHTVAAAVIDPPVRRPSSVMLFHSIQPTESVFHGEWHAPKAVAYEHAKATMDVYNSIHVPNASDCIQDSAQSHTYPWISTYTAPAIDDYSPFGYSPTSPMSVDGAEYYYSGSSGVYEPTPPPPPESYTNWYQEPPTFTNPFSPSARPPPTMYHEVSVSPYDVFPPTRF